MIASRTQLVRSFIGGVSSSTAILKIDSTSNITAAKLAVGNQAVYTGASVYQTGGSLTLTNPAGVNNSLYLGAVAWLVGAVIVLPI